MRRDARARRDRVGGAGFGEEDPDDEWLGGEAHVPFRGGPPAWRTALRSREGFSGLALSLAFAAGILVAGGLAVLNRTRRR